MRVDISPIGDVSYFDVRDRLLEEARSLIAGAARDELQAALKRLERFDVREARRHINRRHRERLARRYGTRTLSFVASAPARSKKQRITPTVLWATRLELAIIDLTRANARNDLLREMGRGSPPVRRRQRT